MTTLKRALRWLLPGLGIKRWIALLLVGLVLEAFGAVLLLNIFAYELTAALGNGQKKSKHDGLFSVSRPN